jgi:hypothetical protein
MDQMEKLQKQAVDLWKKTVKELNDISKSLMKASRLDRIQFDRAKLLAERDKLFKRLGEETYRLIDMGKIKVPKGVRDIYKRIQGVIDRIMQTKKSKKAAPKGTAKTAAKKKKTTKKKATKRKKATKKKVAK